MTGGSMPGTGSSDTELIAKINERRAKVVVVGQGYVGLPVAMRASEVGFDVVGYDVSPQRVAALRAGRSFVEDVSEEQLGAALASGYRPSEDANDLRDFDVAVITVQTPLRENIPDLSFIEAAGRELSAWLTPGSLVVLESTTYPGTTDELLRPILESGGLRAGEDFFLGYSPERIDPGTANGTS
jgi:nucleotide sugar dehydrogenase